MRKILLIWTITCLSAISLLAQQPKCGVSKQAGALIKQRMMNNRLLFSKQQITDLMTNRTVTYIPVSFHSVANSSGDGAATTQEIFDFLCGLNGLYADQDVQFFIYNFTV